MPRTIRDDRQHSVPGARTLELSNEARKGAHLSEHLRGVTSNEQKNRKEQGVWDGQHPQRGIEDGSQRDT